MRNMIIDQPKNMLPDLTDPSLVGAWLNRRTTGGKDYSVNGNDGTLVGDLIPNRVGYYFDGTGDYINIGDIATFDFDGTQDFTVLAWIKTSKAANAIISKYSFAGDDGWLFALNSDELMLTMGGNTSRVFSNEQFSDDIWHRVVGVVEVGELMTLYADGKELTYQIQDVLAAVDTPSGIDLTIGRRDDSVAWDWNGDIKDVRVYTGTKSASWIANDFSMGVPDDSLVLSIQDGTKDLSRYKRDITLNGDVIVGDGIELAGDNDYAELDPEFLEAVSAFTIMFYARSDAIDPLDIQIFKALVDNNRIITRLYIAANGIYDFEVRRTDGTDSNAVITSPFQHKGYIHTACVFNGKANMYINGDFVDDGDVIGDVTPTGGATQYFRVGGSGNTLDGTIKDYKVLLGGKSADWIKNYVEQSKGRY